MMGQPWSSLGQGEGLGRYSLLSSLLFPIIAEGLSIAILEEKRTWDFEGIKSDPPLLLSQLFFVNYILLFSYGLRRDALNIKNIFTYIAMLQVCW